jgi:hypothetical protein
MLELRETEKGHLRKMSECIVDKRDVRRRGSATMKARCRGETAPLHIHAHRGDGKKERSWGKECGIGEAGEREMKTGSTEGSSYYLEWCRSSCIVCYVGIVETRKKC